jgi:ribosomal protein S18 acetylase RimI-like enzyme
MGPVEMNDAWVAVGPYRLIEASGTAEYHAARSLIEEYAAQIGALLGVDLRFQGFAAELDRLPEMYGPPGGCLMLAGRDGEWSGCCALRRFADGVAEMKRLYVKSSARGANLGRLLAQSVTAKARSLGYRRMVLDTLEDMIPAQALYRSLGFRETAPYYFNPMAGVTYMELDLGTAAGDVTRS